MNEKIKKGHLSIARDNKGVTENWDSYKVQSREDGLNRSSMPQKLSKSSQSLVTLERHMKNEILKYRKDIYMFTTKQPAQLAKNRSTMKIGFRKSRISLYSSIEIIKCLAVMFHLYTF